MPVRSLAPSALVASLAATLVLSPIGAPAFAASPYSGIIAFGDSLSDVGNLFALTLSVLPGGPYDNGRFSNGPLWVEDLARSLGLNPPKPSFGYGGGTDQAWAGATTGFPGTANPAAPVLSLTSQVNVYLAGVGSTPSSALYTFSIGSDDIFQILANTSLTPAQVTADLEGAAQTVADDAHKLELAGAKTLLLLNVPNLGLTPSILAEGPVTAAAATSDSQRFNALVETDLENEDSGLLTFTVDAYELLAAVIGNPSAYGFLNVTTPCWTGTDEGSLGPGSLCSTDTSVQDQYLFWDGVHPTEKGQQLLANAALGALGLSATPVPEPATWALMLIAFGGLAAARLRARPAPPCERRARNYQSE
jgi:phospholipase/lecithinase/hemolysin